MTVMYVCDYCGLPIEDGDMATYKRTGRLYDVAGKEIFGSAWGDEVGHYHSYPHDGEPSCQARIYDAIEAAEEAGRVAGAIQTLEAIPTLGETVKPQRASASTRAARTAPEGRKREERSEETREHDDRMRAWQRRPQSDRDGLLFEALGEDRLTIRELTARLNAAVQSPPGRGPTVYESTVAKMSKRMVRDGELEREPETFNKTHTRYRYFRKAALDGPIVDLERPSRDGSEAAA